MRPNTIEAEHIWEGFKREWKFLHWPTPVELCSRLTKFRQAQASLGKAAGTYEPPMPDQRQIEHRPYNHAEFMRYVAEVRRQAASRDPAEARMGRILLISAEALLRNRDDHDRPRHHSDELAA